MRKKLLQLSLLFILLNVLVKHSYAQQIGANFNENIEDIDPLLIQKSGVNWVRGFVNIPRHFLIINKEGAIAGVNEQAIKDFDITPLLNLTDKKIILSLKLDFKFKNLGVPRANSAAGAYLLEAIELFLQGKNLGNKIDILVVGNEPMWETPKEQSKELAQLTNKLIDNVEQLKHKNKWHYEIFVGALNRVSELKKNEIAIELIKIARENPLVKGIDLHIHTNNLQVINDDPAYIRSALNFNKKIICTEFSLVRMFEEHINDSLGIWGERNGYNKNMKLYEWLNQLSQNATEGKPISSAEFYSYFNAQPWYHKQWFNSFLNSFRQHQIAVATYGLQNKLSDRARKLTPKSNLWLLNFVFNGRLLGNDKDSVGNTNPLVYPEFKSAAK